MDTLGKMKSCLGSWDVVEELKKTDGVEIGDLVAGEGLGPEEEHLGGLVVDRGESFQVLLLLLLVLFAGKLGKYWFDLFARK